MKPDSKTTKKIEKLKYLDGDMIKDPFSASLWFGNTFIVTREKINEIIDWINSHETR